jgi:hypothetical protein
MSRLFSNNLATIFDSNMPVLRIQIRDPGSGIWCLFGLWIWDPGSGTNNPDIISESLKPFFELKYLNLLSQIRHLGWKNSVPGWKNSDPGWKKFGSRIRDKHPGSTTLKYVLTGTWYKFVS